MKTQTNEKITHIYLCNCGKYSHLKQLKHIKTKEKIGFFNVYKSVCPYCNKDNLKLLIYTPNTNKEFKVFYIQDYNNKTHKEITKKEFNKYLKEVLK